MYDVAWSGDRKAGADGKLPAVGNTVDVARGHFHQLDRLVGTADGLDRSRFQPG